VSFLYKAYYPSVDYGSLRVNSDSTSKWFDYIQCPKLILGEV